MEKENPAGLQPEIMNGQWIKHVENGLYCKKYNLFF